MAPTITVIIPTCNRPAFLRDALDSVRTQTAQSAITQVIVSENSTNEESEEVCRQFPDLPIDYLLQRPPVSTLVHLRQIWPHVRNPIVAFLFDDDWWRPGHIENALLLLANPSCVAVYSSRYETFSPHAPPFASDVPWLMWIASGCDFRPEALLLDEVSVLLSNLLNVSCHLSTLVARKEAVWDVYQKVAVAGNTFDTDRMWPVFLSSFGSIGYLTKPDTFVRLHPGMDSMKPEHRLKMFNLIQNTTRWLLKTHPERTAQAAKKFNEAMSSLPLELLPRLRIAIYNFVHEPQWTTLIEECGLNLPPRAQFAPPPKRKDARWLLKQCCPPVLSAIRRRLRR